MKEYMKSPQKRHEKVLRTLARRIMEKKWRVQKWDWLEVDHIKWVSFWNNLKNLRILTRLKNRRLWQKKAMIWRLRKKLIQG
jgi:hypothetical protein